MATRPNDLLYLPSLRDDSPQAAQLRRRCQVGAALLLFFFGMLVAVGLSQVVAILALLLVAAGTALFLRDRRRREWLRLRFAPREEWGSLGASRLLHSGRSHVSAGTLRACDRLRGTAAGARGRLRHPRAAVPVDADAPTAERSAVSDADALRCQELGMRLRRNGHPHRAKPLHQSARLIFAETGNRRGEALAMNGLGLALADAGEHEAALHHFERARRLLSELGDGEGEAKVLVNYALVKHRLGDDEGAAELLRAAQAEFMPDSYPYRLVEQHLLEARESRPA